ncbi:MAG: hypothetical protein DMG76_12180 [Acidobacteria bacterium]|nr:MAG: hypothetical protein DMG76_12180 [Acidobacteriota bacterium]
MDAASDTSFVPAVIQGLAFVFKFRSGSWNLYSTSFPQVSTAATPNNCNSEGIKTVPLSVPHDPVGSYSGIDQETKRV